MPPHATARRQLLRQSGRRWPHRIRRNPAAARSQISLAGSSSASSMTRSICRTMDRRALPLTCFSAEDRAPSRRPNCHRPLQSTPQAFCSAPVGWATSMRTSAESFRVRSAGAGIDPTTPENCDAMTASAFLRRRSSSFLSFSRAFECRQKISALLLRFGAARLPLFSVASCSRPSPGLTPTRRRCHQTPSWCWDSNIRLRVLPRSPLDAHLASSFHGRSNRSSVARAARTPSRLARMYSFDPLP